MRELTDYEKRQARNPQWEKADKVHDWRNYISDNVKAIWDTFSNIQKFALLKQADDQASREEWD